MISTLHTWLAIWLAALRRIADLHPAVFSVSAWSVPHSHLESAGDQAIRQTHALLDG
jgi:hypothetical protein